MTSNTSVLNRNRVYYANRRETYRKRFYNCHGATLFTLGVYDRLEWVDRDMIEDYLESFTKPIWRPARVGDILTVTSSYGYGRLEHTAVYLGGGRYFHKRGSNTPEITDLAGVRKIYDGNYKWRRVI